MRESAAAIAKRRSCALGAAILLLLSPGIGASQEGEQKPVHTESPTVLIPGGEFTMGAEGYGHQSPPHTVRISPFYLDKYEVTNVEYLAFCEATDRGLPAFWGMDTLRSGPNFLNHPVVGVSWGDARAYARWRGVRLPTEAEWEYAARGGSGETDYTHGDTFDHEAYATGKQGGPSPVGSFPPNAFGLYDMTGNVCEWVNDWYGEDYYKTSPQEDPRGPGTGWFKVIRGGGWHTGPGCSRVYDRNGLKSNWLDFNVGFRCAKYKGESGALKMEQIIEESGIEAGLAAYSDMKTSEPGTYYFSEFEFNEMGYRLLGKEKAADAIEIFKLNVEAFPDSPNAYDSLGEVYMNQGDRSAAIVNYKRALDLNPGNRGARDALEELEKE